MNYTAEAIRSGRLINTYTYLQPHILPFLSKYFQTACQTAKRTSSILIPCHTTKEDGLIKTNKEIFFYMLAMFQL